MEVFRDSDGVSYRSQTRHQRGETVSLQAFPDVTLTLDAILGRSAG